MAAGVTIKHKRKTSAFSNGELAAGEFGLNTATGVWYYSSDGSTTVSFDSIYYKVGGTDVAIADGGTGASTAANAFSALKQDASETATGVVERLTDAEFTTGTDTTRYPSAAQVKGVAQVVTNKRNQKRVDSQTTTSTITPEIASFDIFIRTALTGALTINNHSTSTPAEGEMMMFKLKDNGTSRAISYGDKYVNFTATKATATTISKWLVQIWQWDSAASQWFLMFQQVQP